jgi:hypothetical protein
MFTQPSVEKPKQHALDWSGWSLQLGRNQEGTYGVWTFRGQAVRMVRAGKA